MTVIAPSFRRPVKFETNFELNVGSEFANGLQLWMPFGFLPGGPNVWDRGLYRFDGTRQGTTTWTPTDRGWGLQFNGSSGYLNVLANPLFKGDSYYFTFWAWVNLASGNGTYTLYASEDTATTGRFIWYASRHASGGVQRIFIESSEALVGSTATDDDKDHLLVYTRTSNNHVFYLDGAVDNSGSSSLVTVNNPNYNWIGARGGGDFLNGRVYEFGFANRPWSAAEVAEYYRQTVGGELSELALPLVRWHPVTVAAVVGRTTKNTRAYPLGLQHATPFVTS